jgi:hypothetical protein
VKLLITQVTRMSVGSVCVAGLNLESGDHARPVRPGAKHLNLDDWDRYGGPFGIGSVVELSGVARAGTAPHVEDVQFSHAARTSTVSLPDLSRALESLAETSLGSIFGLDPQPPTGESQALAVPQGQGSASLGVWSPGSVHDVRVVREAVRMIVACAGRLCDLQVNDASLYSCDDGEWTVSKSAVAEYRARALQSGGGPILCVGLTRAFDQYGRDVPRHYVQVNAMYSLRTTAQLDAASEDGLDVESQAILAALKNSSAPVLAKELAAVVSRSLGRTIDRSDTNRRLFGSLRTRVRQDGSYRWSLR